MTPAQQLDGFLRKFSPETARKARAALAKVGKLLPGAHRLVYDNYNALAIGFAGGERAGEVAVSVAVFPRWVSLFLFGGTDFDDPQGLLAGSGRTVRHIVLEPVSLLDTAAVKSLVKQAVLRAKTEIPRTGRGKLIIKSISKKQRPRR